MLVSVVINFPQQTSARRRTLTSHNKLTDVFGRSSNSRISSQQALLVIADSSFHEQQADNLRVEYERLRGSYRGHPVIDNDLFDTEVICRIISNMKRGKASGIDGLSVEHSGVFRGGGTGQCPPPLA